jgi:hypothetical protein
MSRYIEEIQVFEQASGRIHGVFIGRLMKVNDKTIHIEHDIDSTRDGGLLRREMVVSAGCGNIMMTYPKMESWGVRTRLAGANGKFVEKYSGWDRRVGAGRPRAFEGHQTSDVRGPYNSGNGKTAGYGGRAKGGKG